MALGSLHVGGPRFGRGESGQMSVELMAVLPIAIAIAAIAVNALVFFGDCATFDRVSRNAVRTYATSPTYGEGASQSEARIAAAVQEAMQGPFERVHVAYTGMGGGLTRYTVMLDYTPNLFGLGICDAVFGVRLPHLRHSTSLVVNAYKPGIFFE